MLQFLPKNLISMAEAVGHKFFDTVIRSPDEGKCAGFHALDVTQTDSFAHTIAWLRTKLQEKMHKVQETLIWQHSEECNF